MPFSTAMPSSAMNPTDASEAALTKVLSDLQAQFERVQRNPPTWSDNFAMTLLEFDAWPVDFFVQKLGLTAEEVEDAELDDGIYPCDLFADDGVKEKLAKNGVKTPADLYKKLFG